MNQRFRSLIIQLLLLGAGVLMLYLAFRGQNMLKLLTDLRRADYRYVAASLAVLLFSHLLRAIRWKMLIKPLGYNPTAMNCFCAVMIGYLANLAVPRLGEITRCSILYRTDKAPVDKLIGTVITERIADVLLLFLILVLVAFMEAELITKFLQNQFFGKSGDRFSGAVTEKVKLLALVLVFLAILIFFLRKKKEIILGLGPVKKISGFITGIFTGIGTIIAMPNKGLFVFYSFAIWFLYALSTWLVFSALPATTGLSFQTALYVLAAGSIGMIAPVQGGIGTYHFMVSQALVLLGIASTEGLAYATLNHSSQLILFLVIGSLALGYLFFKGMKMRSMPNQSSSIPNQSI